MKHIVKCTFIEMLRSSSCVNFSTLNH